jgi:hypothetical protein
MGSMMLLHNKAMFLGDGNTPLRFGGAGEVTLAFIGRQFHS